MNSSFLADLRGIEFLSESEDSCVSFRPTEAGLFRNVCLSALALSLYFIDVLLFSFQGSFGEDLNCVPHFSSCRCFGDNFYIISTYVDRVNN